MPRLRSRRLIGLLVTPVLIARVMFGMSHASAANASLGAPASLSAPAAPSTPAARSVSATPQAHGNPLWAVPLRLLYSTRERPLFSASRRPPPPHRSAPPSVAAVPAAPPPPKPSRPDLRLVGTIIGDRESIGVFVEDGTARMLRLRTGEGHEGWILRHIGLRKVTLDNDVTRAVLVLPTPGSDPQHAIPSPYARGTRRVHH